MLLFGGIYMPSAGQPCRKKQHLIGVQKWRGDCCRSGDLCLKVLWSQRGDGIFIVPGHPQVGSFEKMMRILLQYNHIVKWVYPA